MPLMPNRCCMHCLTWSQTIRRPGTISGRCDKFSADTMKPPKHIGRLSPAAPLAPQHIPHWGTRFIMPEGRKRRPKPGNRPSEFVRIIPLRSRPSDRLVDYDNGPREGHFEEFARIINMRVPPCHSRRELPTTPGVMYCVHPRVRITGMIVRPEICRRCNYCKEPAPETFQPFPPQPLPPPRGRCEFLGDVVGHRDCPTCSGKVRLKVFACSHPAHDEPTLLDCLKCADHREAGMAAPNAVASG
jgi:hypothetical protein